MVKNQPMNLTKVNTIRNVKKQKQECERKKIKRLEKWCTNAEFINLGVYRPDAHWQSIERLISGTVSPWLKLKISTLAA